MAVLIVAGLAILFAIVLLILMGAKPSTYPPDGEIVTSDDFEEDRVVVKQPRVEVEKKEEKK